ncbi:tagaturonate reductase [Flavimarina sp. Hel_I_48]|uniref:tagaturonate reductase n=1 Tax=Flavimarina sp. Hel_I_48 TaxID=1392488 RepID=UPI0004DF905A|nr:tagaturonate reductase [Flavimarina sp. Hel_I_48]
MKLLNRINTGLTDQLPLKIIQYGEGNFLRGFADYIIEELNKKANLNAGVVVVKPRKGNLDQLEKQDGLYNLFTRGVEKGHIVDQNQLISCIQKCVVPHSDYDAYLDLAKIDTLEFLISNTTEAGIAFDENDASNKHPHKSFPAKVTALLYKRFTHFKGGEDKGLTIIPCELINNNAGELKEIILKYTDLWSLGEDFKKWLQESNSFHNTLVDRIVPGFPQDSIDAYQQKLEFEDKLIVSAEKFLLWAIEGDKKLMEKIPFHKLEENIQIVTDLQPFRTRKVRILNGAHTTMVPFSLLYGNETVKGTIDNDFTGTFIKKAVYDEINGSLDLPKKELDEFADAVFDRFINPFIKHKLSSIALNSISKFKVRVLPSLVEYQQKFNRLPVHLTFGLACLIRFYKGEWKGTDLPLNDEENIIKKMNEIWQAEQLQEVAQQALQNMGFWGQDLTKIDQLALKIALALQLIETEGIENGFKKFTAEFPTE